MNRDSLLVGENAAYLDERYQQWMNDPASADPEWAQIFAEWSQSVEDSPGGRVRPEFEHVSIFRGRAQSGAVSPVEAQKQARVAQLINAYRVWGHKKADIDPLGELQRLHHPELTLGFWGLDEADLDRQFATAPLVGMPDFAPLRAILKQLQATYSAVLGAEFMNINSVEQKTWVQERLERLPGQEVLNKEEERRVLRKMSDAENFERLLHQRFPGTKRFSLEGGETLVPLMDVLVEYAASLGVLEVVIGMAHRGRLNLLANVMQKPVDHIVAEFEDTPADMVQGSGDVKYHLGYSSDTITSNGDKIHLSLTPNPSHLEAVNPVVEGRVRAKQDRHPDSPRQATLPILIHGDAAFAGQGIVAETLQLSELPAYRTEGTIHIIVNNQIGFTTGADEARSTAYSTGIARMLGVPIFHVNGESPRAVAAAVKIAVEWRQRFNRDVVIDMYCYRKYGHNEGDEPAFTQPALYKLIRKRPTPRAAYGQFLVENGYMTDKEVEVIANESRTAMEQALLNQSAQATLTASEQQMSKGADPDVALYGQKSDVNVVAAKQISVDVDTPTKGLWSRYAGDIREETDTSLPMETLQDLIRTSNTLPETFQAHPKIRRILNQRLDVAEGKRAVDWAVAEQAAFASLVSAGFGVRISGQDAGRGTFSHRHAILVSPETGERYIPLRNMGPSQGQFEVWNSFLSEAAVLGFEYGYSMDCPNSLVLWEAQFGDFVNGAQVLIDQFIVSGEQKWGRMSGLVMLLPHGMESQGPEHSSARLERFMMACAQDNIQVANCTTPANFFHLLRRQIMRRARKPLIVMSPKSLLRAPDATSTLEDLASGAFQSVIEDTEASGSVKRIVFCSGKVYYDLARKRASEQVKGIALHRVEMLYPFPHEAIGAIVKASPKAEVIWCQEEPRNMGAWPRLLHWFQDHFPKRPVRYVGRPESAAPSVGSGKVDRQQQAKLVAEALELRE